MSLLDDIDDRGYANPRETDLLVAAVREAARYREEFAKRGVQTRESMEAWDAMTEALRPLLDDHAGMEEKRARYIDFADELAAEGAKPMKHCKRCGDERPGDTTCSFCDGHGLVTGYGGDPTGCSHCQESGWVWPPRCQRCAAFRSAESMEEEPPEIHPASSVVSRARSRLGAGRVTSVHDNGYVVLWEDVIPGPFTTVEKKDDVRLADEPRDQRLLGDHAGMEEK